MGLSRDNRSYCHIRICVLESEVSRAEASNYTLRLLWDVITCPCPWYLFLAHTSSYQQNAVRNLLRNIQTICVLMWFIVV